MQLYSLLAGLFLAACLAAGLLYYSRFSPVRGDRRRPRPRWFPTRLLEGVGGALRLSLLFGGAVGLIVLAGAFSLPLFQASSDSVTLPIEVIGPDGHTVSVQVNASDGSATEALYLKAYSIGYPYHLANLRGYSVDKASIKINDGAWVDVNNSTVNCVAPDSDLRCVDGPLHTVRFRIPASTLGSFEDGANMVHFRFNYAAPSPEKGDPSTGYRILDLELESSSGADLIDGTSFQWDEPGSWTAPEGFGSSSDVEEGEALWSARNTLVDGWGGEQIWASCADCHTKSGYDLQYFAFSNHSIVQRSRFHGLSETEGKKIAAYIRSIQIETYDGQAIAPPGRPWNPPYQPGPTQASSRPDGAPRTEGAPISELDPIYWAAGAGLEWALDDDAVTKQYLFPNGVVPSEMPVSGSLNQREIPVALQMPDWNEWLPVHHPIDVWGDRFRDHKTYQDYLNRTPDNLWKAQNGDYQKLEDATKPIWAGLEQGRDNFKGRSVPEPYDWQVAELSRMQWALTKHFETLVPTHMENKVQEFRGPQADRLQWPSDSRIVFDQAPHIGVKRSDGSTTKGQDHDLMDRYFDTTWYQLQMVINSGATYSTGQSPIDWRYHFRHIPGIGVHPWRYAVSYLRLLQNAETIAEDGNNPLQENTSEGWHMRHVSPVHIDGQHIWFRDGEQKLSRDENRRLLNVVAKMFADGMSENDPDRWKRIENSDQGLDPADQTPSRYTGPIGQKSEYDRHWWTALKNYGEAGVAYELLKPLAQWAERAWPKGDWMALIEPYKDNPPFDEDASPSVNLEAPRDGARIEASTALTLKASATDPDGTVSSVEFFANGSSLGTDTDATYAVTWSDVPAGTHTLTAVATDNDGKTTTSSSVEVVAERDGGGAPSVTYAYFEGEWTQLPDFDALTPVVADTAGSFNLDLARRADHFGFRFQSYLHVPADTTYTFYTESDDGSALYVGDSLVVDNDGTHSAAEASGSIRLSEGYHPLTVEYFEATEAQSLAVRWSSDAIAKAPIPRDRLYAERPSRTVTQTFVLREGWNLISSHAAPTDPSMATIFADVRDDLVVAKGENGRIYSPSYNVTSLSRWESSEAYQVYLTARDSISITGPKVTSDTPIPLQRGWNLVSYLPSSSLPVEEAFASLGENLVVVEDVTGAPYIPDPEYDVNKIGTVGPGEGFKVYVERADTLRYPASVSKRKTVSSSPAPAPQGGPTTSTLLVDAPNREDGTVVRALAQQEVVARARLSDGTAVLTIPGRSRFTSGDRPRAEEGDRITLTAGPSRTRLPVTGLTSVLDRSVESSLTFRPESVLQVTTAQPGRLTLKKNYPNPVRTTTTIAYAIPEQTRVSLRVYNVLGQQVATLVEGSRQPGRHEVEFDASSLSSGVYFYRLETGQRTRSRKLTIVQ